MYYIYLLQFGSLKYAYTAMYVCTHVMYALMHAEGVETAMRLERMVK